MTFSTLASLISKPHFRRLFRRGLSARQALGVRYTEQETIRIVEEETHTPARRLSPSEAKALRLRRHFEGLRAERAARRTGRDATEAQMTWDELRRFNRAHIGGRH